MLKGVHHLFGWFVILSIAAYAVWALVLWKGTDAQKAWVSALFLISPIPPIP